MEEEDENFVPAAQFLESLGSGAAFLKSSRPSLAQIRGIRNKIDIFENKFNGVGNAGSKGALGLPRGACLAAKKHGVPLMPAVVEEDEDTVEGRWSSDPKLTPQALRRQSLRANAARVPSVLFDPVFPGSSKDSTEGLAIAEDPKHIGAQSTVASNNNLMTSASGSIQRESRDAVGAAIAETADGNRSTLSHNHESWVPRSSDDGLQEMAVDESLGSQPDEELCFIGQGGDLELHSETCKGVAANHLDDTCCSGPNSLIKTGQLQRTLGLCSSKTVPSMQREASDSPIRVVRLFDSPAGVSVSGQRAHPDSASRIVTSNAEQPVEPATRGERISNGTLETHECLGRTRPAETGHHAGFDCSFATVLMEGVSSQDPIPDAAQEKNTLLLELPALQESLRSGDLEGKIRIRQEHRRRSEPPLTRPQAPIVFGPRRRQSAEIITTSAESFTGRLVHPSKTHVVQEEMEEGPAVPEPTTAITTSSQLHTEAGGSLEVCGPCILETSNKPLALQETDKQGGVAELQSVEWPDVNPALDTAEVSPSPSTGLGEGADSLPSSEAVTQQQDDDVNASEEPQRDMRHEETALQRSSSQQRSSSLSNNDALLPGIHQPCASFAQNTLCEASASKGCEDGPSLEQRIVQPDRERDACQGTEEAPTAAQHRMSLDNAAHTELLSNSVSVAASDTSPAHATVVQEEIPGTKVPRRGGNLPASTPRIATPSMLLSRVEQTPDVHSTHSSVLLEVTPASTGMRLAAELVAVASSVSASRLTDRQIIISTLSEPTLTTATPLTSSCVTDREATISPVPWPVEGEVHRAADSTAASPHVTKASGESDVGTRNSPGKQVTEVSLSPSGSLDEEECTLQFTTDVARMLEALDVVTPTTTADKPQRSKNQQPRAKPHRLSFAIRGGILDMDAFDASGHPTQPGQATPLLARSRPSATGAPSGTGLSLSKGLDTGDRNHALRSKPPHPPPHEDQGDDSLSHLSEQQLREKVSYLETWSREASTLLSSYQFAISELEDRHSSALVTARTEVRLLTVENAEMKAKLDTLIAEHHAECQRKDQEIASAQQALLDQRTAMRQAQQVELKAIELEAQKKLKAEEAEHQDALNELRTQIEELEGSLAKQREQTRQTAHQAALAKAARDRACSDSVRKEEELVALKVQMEAVSTALADYKTENSKAAEMKIQYKSIIAGLETELRESRSEKASLVSVCNELMARLEARTPLLN